LRRLVDGANRPDLKVLCVNLWDTPAWIKRYAEGNGGGLLFATGFGEAEPCVANVVGGRLMGYYVVNRNREAVYEVKGFPTTYVIDKDGRVVATHLGMAQWSNPPVSSWISGLLASRKPAETTVQPDGGLPVGLDRLLSSNFRRNSPSGRGPVRGAETVPLR